MDYTLRDLRDCTIFAMGKGPGPKNVGLVLADGRKMITTYRNYTWLRDQLQIRR